jgi:hypothetical protein
MIMGKVYEKIKDELEKEGYTPFVCIIKWPPQDEAAAIERYLQVFKIPEGTGLKGVHTWNLIGRNSMIVIGWMNSTKSLQKFCTSVTYGTSISMEVCPAIDHFGLTEALEELTSTKQKKL